jgi:signal transduction histidine kinase/CheY-like chemotaxis protein
MSTQSELSRALVAHTYTQLPAAAISSGIASLLFAAVAMANHVGGAPLFWLAFQVVGHSFNFAIYFAFARGHLEPSQERALTARRIGVVLTGLGWGLGGAIWPMHAGGLGSGMAFCIAGMMAGATSTLAGDEAAYALFGSTSILPNVFRTDLSMWWVSALLVGFFVATCYITRQNALALRASLSLRWENTELLAQAISDRASAERAARSRTRFLAAASHDLRQPVQALTLFIDVLAREPLAPAEDRARAVQALERTSDALRAMLEGLFDLSRLDAGVVISSPRPVAIVPLFEEVMAALHDEAGERDVVMSKGGPALSVLADPALLARVVHNLGSNAVRHGGPGRVLFASRRRGGSGLIELWDQGAGIGEADRERIFEEFVQLENPERDRGRGLGLGLPMVRRICALSGWPLEVRSVLGKGTVFRVRLPLAEATPPMPVRPALAARQRRGTLLLVEDDVLLREAAASFFEAEGFSVDAARSGDEALVLLARMKAEGRAPDVLVTDHRLPGALTGAALAKHLRRSRERLPVVLMSGDLEAPFLREPPPAGVTLLRKPVDGETLLSAVLGLIDEQRREVPGAQDQA